MSFINSTIKGLWAYSSSLPCHLPQPHWKGSHAGWFICLTTWCVYNHFSNEKVTMENITGKAFSVASIAVSLLALSPGLQNTLWLKRRASQLTLLSQEDFFNMSGGLHSHKTLPLKWRAFIAQNHSYVLSLGDWLSSGTWCFHQLTGNWHWFWTCSVSWLCCVSNPHKNW